MAWAHVRSAKGVSLPTWTRRIAGGWPSYIDANGFRIVWVGELPPELLADEVKRLRKQVESLEDMIQTLLSRLQVDTARGEPLAAQLEQEPCAADEPQPTRQWGAHAPQEGKVDRLEILRRVATITERRKISLRAVDREAGLRSFTDRAFNGEKRGAKADASWRKLEAWCDQQEASASAREARGR